MLNSFNSIVLNVAVITLIIVLIVIGVVINNSVRGQNIKFPPVVGTCPDYWSASDHAGNTLCQNTITIGEGNLIMKTNPSHAQTSIANNSMCTEFLSSSVPATCDKYNLAKSCNLTWDGVTNNDSNRTACQ
jgi:hypothetical protein